MTQFQRRQLTLMRQMESQALTAGSTTSIVPMLTDYANDSQLCLTCVSFLPEKLVSTVRTKLIGSLSRIEPDFYYYLDTSLHVTIQNIRVVNHPPQFGPQDVARVKAGLTDAVPEAGPFQMELWGVLRLLTSASIIVLVDAAYDQFVKRLRKRLKDAGVADDKKYFTDELVFANSTFVRFTHKPSPAFTEKLNRLRDIPLGTLEVTEISLIQTNAVCHPSKTTILGSYRFSA